MTDAAPDPSAGWTAAVLAATLFAVDPVGLGGIAVRSAVGPVRDRWLAMARTLLPADAPVRRMPATIDAGRLLGGLDLSASLRAGRPVAARGLLAEADGGVVIAAMAERMESGTAAQLAAALDTGEVRLARDGLEGTSPARFGVIALDEGIDDERLPPALSDRLGFRVDLTAIAVRDAAEDWYTRADVEAARGLLPEVTAGDEVLEALAAGSLLLGVDSARAPLMALRAARAAAALDGRRTVSRDDTALAARLVLAPRATRLPADESEPEAQPDQPPPPPDDPSGEESGESEITDRPLEDMVLEAVRAALPAGLLALGPTPPPGRSRAAPAGKAGAMQRAGVRGRPAGVRPGKLIPGARLNIAATLQAAAPWQRLRRTEPTGGAGVMLIRPDDFRITRYRPRAETTTIFVVDASGSSALNRLAEAKGAVELLLADCYVRRDKVALIAFRGRAATVLLPPTRALARARRSLATLPGGGGTPLAAGLDAALALADATRRQGATPSVVVLTDGRANVARDGTGGRARADADAIASARRVRAAAITSLLVDTSPRPHPPAGKLAAEMGGVYLALPRADAAALSRAVRDVATPRPTSRG